jgi:hypothetical protein
MSAEVIRFPKDKVFNAVKHFGVAMAETKHGLDYATDMTKYTLHSTINAMVSMSQEEPQALRYYFKDLFNYSYEDMAKVVDNFPAGDIYMVLASKAIDKQWLAIQKYKG